MKPSSINVHRKSATLELKFPNNEAYTLSAEYLRVFRRPPKSKDILPIKLCYSTENVT